MLSVFAFGFLFVLLNKTNPVGNCCLSFVVWEGSPSPVCFVQSIHSFIFESGPSAADGRKVLIFKDLLLQSIPSMALSISMEEEDEQVLGLSPEFYSTLSVKG